VARLEVRCGEHGLISDVEKASRSAPRASTACSSGHEPSFRDDGTSLSIDLPHKFSNRLRVLRNRTISVRAALNAC
jgi:hypothetical protein